ncbi:hypothetical protein DU504_09395 [Haloplanus salinus]|uniref:Uncharacterized protein n=1 Tax=Haloplanus salinus TaxID=1126245 RepID=A0A368NAB7_9EURY|nr:hypothetical protein [Haloplanus salinus]RCU47492.1 hypothetical protein DU504_09395 [Haloplanus salinus]
MIDTDELSAEESPAVVDAQMLRKALAYRHLADGIEVLEDEDSVFESLVNSITKQHPSATTGRHALGSDTEPHEASGGLARSRYGRSAEVGSMHGRSDSAAPRWGIDN